MAPSIRKVEQKCIIKPHIFEENENTSTMIKPST